VNRMIPAVAAAAALIPTSAQAADELDVRFVGTATVEDHMEAGRYLQVHRQLVARYEALTGDTRRSWGVKRLRAEIRGERRERRERRRARRLQRSYSSVAVPGHLEAIAACESGGDPSAIGGGGLYRGKYQFDYATWASVGGSGDPAAASEAEQDMRAAMLYERAGAAPWPVCGS
jgi:hypothetical protein